MTIVTEVGNGYDIKLLNENHLDQILYLQEIVIKNLSDPTIYYAEPTQFFRRQIAIQKSVIGLFQKKQLVGFHMASFPGLNEENLGADVGIKQEDLLHVAQLGPIAVHPDHRKRGLLSKLVERHLQVIREMGYRHICVTVAPNNYPSIKVFIDSGFVIKQVKLKFGNLLRYILYLALDKPLKQLKYSVRIPNTDIESQKYIMGLGFYGYDVLKNENGFDLAFGRNELDA